MTVYTIVAAIAVLCLVPALAVLISAGVLAERVKEEREAQR